MRQIFSFLAVAALCLGISSCYKGGFDPHGYRREFRELISRAKEL